MKRDVVWSQEGLADLRNLFQFIARDSPRNAHKVADRIENSIDLISATPFGRVGRVPGTFEVSVAKIPFIIVYQLPDDAALAVLCVIHTSRDWPPGRWPKD